MASTSPSDRENRARPSQLRKLSALFALTEFGKICAVGWTFSVAALIISMAMHFFVAIGADESSYLRSWILFPIGLVMIFGPFYALLFYIRTLRRLSSNDQTRSTEN